ncbi:TetR/AcrR family transcriptional regulator [Pseudahrensia aquimaris]|uniref:TetR/AcrR family transcriptional regulator n=1 Tax=Pseudahrensia aquimaris TaxID=744461 RepID=A0ABW3FGA7_9HYPH
MNTAVQRLETRTRGVSAPSDGAPDARTEVLNAAAECFKEQGFSATSIDDVARHLGATKGMIYHHFRSKTDLFFEVYRRGMEINVEAIESTANRSDTAIQKLTRKSFAHAAVLMARQNYQRVLAQGVQLHQQGSTTAAQRDTLNELIEIRNAYEARFRNAIAAAAKEAGVTVSDLSLASKSYLAVINSTVFWYSPRTENPAREQAKIAADLVTFAMQGVGIQADKEVLKQTGASA